MGDGLFRVDGLISATPLFEVAAKEVYEETGLIARPVRLLALFDKWKHPHPPQPWYVYKAFIQCEATGGSLRLDTPETADARWFRYDELPYQNLSTDRTTPCQLETVLRLASDLLSATVCD